MRIARAPYEHATRRFLMPGLHGLHCSDMAGLGAAPPFPNPYPHGISVAGTGPNNSATIWATGFDTRLGMYVAGTGFGVAPIFQDPSIFWTPSCDWIGNCGPPQADPNARQNAPAPLNAANDYAMDVSQPMPYLTLFTPGGGGQQDIQYGFDAKTGYYIPVSARGLGGGSNMFDALVHAAVIIGASYAAVAVASSLIAPTVAAPIAPAAPVEAPIAPVPELVGPPVELAPMPPLDLPTPPIDPGILNPTLAPIQAPLVDISPVVTSPASGLIGQAFTISKYVTTVAGAYKQVASLTASHPAAGTVTQLPDGSHSVINPDGTTTVYIVNDGTQTIGPGGSITTGPAPASGAGAGLLLAAIAGIGLFAS